MRYYAEARDRIRERLAVLSEELGRNGSSAGEKRVIFYGAGEASEIAYLCLQELDLKLIGVIDEFRASFFDIPVFTSAQLHATDIDGTPFGRLVITSFGEADEIRLQLGALAIPPDRIFWMWG
jgi:hypothetical protein